MMARLDIAAPADHWRSRSTKPGSSVVGTRHMQQIGN
jgi:hypothetical protein